MTKKTAEKPQKLKSGLPEVVRDSNREDLNTNLEFSATPSCSTVSDDVDLR
jgi:hypothetical protein